jgi:hypothetical protein
VVSIVFFWWGITKQSSKLLVLSKKEKSKNAMKVLNLSSVFKFSEKYSDCEKMVNKKINVLFCSTLAYLLFINLVATYPVISVSVGLAKPKSRILSSQSSFTAILDGFKS